ncbi:MAG: hypothetical protein JW950_06405 [Deltaproteobacteria bacterium]|nr:hypothetical protein [Deltaproteobacteria bacterium]
MSGKEYVSEAFDNAERVMTEIGSSDRLAGDPLVAGAAKACQDLGELRSKASLRTKRGTSMAFPVLDAARNLEEAWEDARGGGDGEDLRTRMDEFISAVDALEGALKDRTVIMT